MLTLAAAISVPNLQKVHVDAVQLDSNTNIGTVIVSAQGGGGIIYGTYALQIKDGQTQGLRATASPLGYNDRLEIFTATVATAFTDLAATYVGANVTAKNKAAESSLLAAGLLPAGTVA